MNFSDEQSVLAVPDVSAVSDPAARHMFYFLIEEYRKVHCALNHSIQASNAATAQLHHVSVAWPGGLDYSLRHRCSSAS